MGPANVGGSISHIPLRNLVSHEREQEICISFLSSFSIFCSQSGLYLLLALLRSFPIKCKSRINCKMPHASFLARISIPICEIIQFLNITTLTLFPFNLTRKSVWRPSEVSNISLYDPLPTIFFLCMSFAQSFCFYLIDGTLAGILHVRFAFWHCSFSKVATREIFLCNVSFQNCSLAIHEKLKICHTLPLFMHAAASIVAAT